MSKISYDDGVKVDVECSMDMGYNNIEVSNIIRDTIALNQQTPLTKFHFRQSGLEYVYEFVLVSGAKWIQKIKIVGGTAEMTFEDIEGWWKEKDFILHRPIRAAIIGMIVGHGLTKFKIDF